MTLFPERHPSRRARILASIAHALCMAGYISLMGGIALGVMQ
jgi:hypothetical protein